MTTARVSLRVLDGLTTGEAPAPADHKALTLDDRTYARSLDCVHCGLCLPACPTYTENGLESDSPRGRISIMKGLADGRLEATPSVVEHLDLCLDCRACETACPSGVVYHELIEETRHRLHVARKKSLVDRMVESMFFHVFPHPARLKLALLPPRLLQRLGLWGLVMKLPLPPKLDKMRSMLPAGGPVWVSDLATRYPALSPRRMTVGLFQGCVGSVMFQQTNHRTIAVLRAAGCDVVVPRGQACCGAIHHHGGKVDEAAAMARRNIDAFAGVDLIVNNAAGCGAMLKDYAHLLRDDPAYAEKARLFVDRSRDICELLVELDPPRPTHPVPRTVTYHDACHLTHAQRLALPPRKVLSWIAGLTVVPLVEAEMCCGAAGTYNLSQPDMARQLAHRKLDHIRNTGASTCVTGNVGCAMQIAGESAQRGMPLEVAHPIDLLHEAYFGSDPSSPRGSQQA